MTVFTIREFFTSALSFISKIAEYANFSSFGRSEQSMLQSRSGSIGMVLSTKYTEVARFSASLSILLPSFT